MGLNAIFGAREGFFLDMSKRMRGFNNKAFLANGLIGFPFFDGEAMANRAFVMRLHAVLVAGRGNFVDVRVGMFNIDKNVFGRDGVILLAVFKEVFVSMP